MLITYKSGMLSNGKGVVYLSLVTLFSFLYDFMQTNRQITNVISTLIIIAFTISTTGKKCQECMDVEAKYCELHQEISRLEGLVKQQHERMAHTDIGNCTFPTDLVVSPPPNSNTFVESSNSN